MDSVISKAGVVGLLAACVLSVGSALAEQRGSNSNAAADCQARATSAFATKVAGCDLALRISDPRDGSARTNHQLCISGAQSEFNAASAACQGSALRPLAVTRSHRATTAAQR